MSAEEIAERPVVLLVEDDEEQLEWRVREFSEAGCMTIGVASHDDAVRELRAGPAVDLVITDIRLTTHDEDDDLEADKSGVALARYVQRTYVDLPVTGYSAYFEDRDLVDEKDAFDRLFDHVWKKGEQDYREFDEMISYCRRRAVAHRLSRRKTAFDVHAALRRRHEIQHPDVDLMRELHPAAEPAPVESVLREAGYRLKLVEARSTDLSQPIIVWLLDVGGKVDAEVYGQPALYAHGATDEEAIVGLIDLMRLYAAELATTQPDEAAGPMISLTDFLRRTMEGESGSGAG